MVNEKIEHETTKALGKIYVLHLICTEYRKEQNNGETDNRYNSYKLKALQKA